MAAFDTPVVLEVALPNMLPTSRSYARREGRPPCLAPTDRALADEDDVLY